MGAAIPAPAGRVKIESQDRVQIGAVNPGTCGSCRDSKCHQNLRQWGHTTRRTGEETTLNGQIPKRTAKRGRAVKDSLSYDTERQPTTGRRRRRRARNEERQMRRGREEHDMDDMNLHFNTPAFINTEVASSFSDAAFKNYVQLRVRTGP